MFHFRLSRRIALPGPFRLNISKRGLSLSAKTLVTTYNFPLLGRKRPRRATVNLPGTGLSLIGLKPRSKPKRKAK
jgi:Protein of unknown function (DUF4236)